MLMSHVTPISRNEARDERNQRARSSSSGRDWYRPPSGEHRELIRKSDKGGDERGDERNAPERVRATNGLPDVLQFFSVILLPLVRY